MNIIDGRRRKNAELSFPISTVEQSINGLIGAAVTRFHLQRRTWSQPPRDVGTTRSSVIQFDLRLGLLASRLLAFVNWARPNADVTLGDQHGIHQLFRLWWRHWITRKFANAADKVKHIFLCVLCSSSCGYRQFKAIVVNVLQYNGVKTVYYYLLNDVCWLIFHQLYTTLPRKIRAADRTFCVLCELSVSEH